MIFKNNIYINVKSSKIISLNNNKRILSNLFINDLTFIDNENEQVAYITNISNEKGEIYILTNSDSPYKKRFIFIIKPDYTYDNKLIVMNSSYLNKYPLIALIKIEGIEYLITTSYSDGHFELISYETGNIYYSSTTSINMKSSSEILKNTFLSIKNKDNSYYVINAYIDSIISKFKIQKLLFTDKNIRDKPIRCSDEKIGVEASKQSPVSCFKLGNYIECLYTNSALYYIVSIFHISNLEELYQQKIEDTQLKSEELFNKCIHIKDNLGAFFYFINYDQFPKLQLLNLEINQNKYNLSSSFDIININSKGSFSLCSKYFQNNFIKTKENTIYFISTQSNSINLYIILIRLLNNYKNILINYYNVKLNEIYNIRLNQDITAFSLNGLLGIGMTVFNYNLYGIKNSTFCLFGNLTTIVDISINLEQNITFNEENQYEIEINNLLQKVYVRNNIFGYEIEGIKFKSELNDENGFYIYSKKLENKINNNQIILSTDIISFKLISEIGIKLGKYSIEYNIIIKEPEYNIFISNAEIVELFPKNDINNYTLYESFYEPNTFSGKSSFINFTINECYKTCQTCERFGDSTNHHCSICSTNFTFSYITSVGNNCAKNCPENYEISDNNTCLKMQEESNIINEIEDEEDTDYETNIIEEENKKEEEDNEPNYEYNKEENDIDITYEIINSEIKKEKSDESENIYHNFKEEKINEHNCKKYFYIDENSNIHCIEGENCIDEYPHLDKHIKNLCTNCIYKYKNKCYMDCPDNTCIKQDINLDICIDIEENTKVINKICFDNFQDIVNNIKELSENNIIIENIPNLTIYVYDIEKNISYFEEKKLTYIYFNDIQDNLIEEFNLEKNTKIYALVVDSPSKYSNSAINDYGFVLLLENGTELNLSYLSDDIKVKISIPIINLELANFDLALAFSQQGYDIYDKNNAFYHDICTPGYLNDDDIAFKDRKKEIFPNDVYIGKTNCEHKISDLNNERFVYNCFISDINKNNTNNNEKINFDMKPKKEKFINYILDVVNYKVLNCSILFMNIDNFRHNKAVMICTTSIFISILLLIIFFCSRLSKLRILMYKEIPTSFKINKSFLNKKNDNLIIKSNNVIKHNQNNKKNSSHLNIKREKMNEQKFQISLDSKGMIAKTNINHKNSSSEKNKNLNIYIMKDSQKKRLSKIKYENKKIGKKTEEKQQTEYDDLPFQMALKMDDRKWIYIFKLKIIEKIKIFDICMNKNIKEILLSEYFLYLLINLTMNALLYSDNIVSHKSHNNGKLDSIIVISLSAFANILASIIGYYLEILICFEEKLFQIKEIKREIVFLRVFKIINREIIIRVLIFFIFEIIIIICCTYYLFIFFTIYHKSQMSLLKNYLISLIENWLINFVIAILIVLFRKIGIYCRNKYIYNTSKYLDKNF